MIFVPGFIEEALRNLWQRFRNHLYRAIIPSLLPSSREVKRIVCPRCQGKGQQLMQRKTFAGTLTHSQVCPKCLGDGEIYTIARK